MPNIWRRHPVSERKVLSCTRSVEAACILFELNTRPSQILHLAREAGLPHCADTEAERQLCLQWYGFVHAAVVAGLMAHAPNAVVVAYLRGTTGLLAARGLSAEESAAFVDTVFSPYMQLLAEERQRECPALFFQQVCHLPSLDQVPPHTVAMISGAMAMTISAVVDKMERYDMRAED